MSCEYCEISEGEGNATILYRDEDIIVAIKDNVFTPGQITIFPIQHATILEMVPSNVLAKCATISNKVSVAAFESLGSQGTNIFIQNGLGAGQKIPHFAIEIVPRQENDSLPLQWDPKPLAEDELERLSTQLQEAAKTIQVGKDPEPKEEEKKEPKEEKPKEKEADNYLLKSLQRQP
jgi:histidine triad (HIT) family protein